MLIERLFPLFVVRIEMLVLPKQVGAAGVARRNEKLRKYSGQMEMFLLNLWWWSLLGVGIWTVKNY
jgi:hypothetical protein